MLPRDWWTNHSLTFQRPWLLLLLLLIPLLAWLRGHFGPQAAILFSATAPFHAIAKRSVSRARQFLRALFWLALAALMVALARPQLGRSLTQIEASGIDIMLVLDVSGSMLAKDFTIGGEESTRLDAVREVTRKFIEARPNDRIGMIAFGSQPYVVSPMTLDHDWLLQNLDRVRIGLVETATAIGSAMASAGNRLNDKHSKSRVIVLMTDGENNAGRISPETAAQALRALHIHFYAIGVGTTGPAAVAPVMNTLGQVVGMIPVPFNADELGRIAQIADGKFYRATDTESLQSIFTDIDKLEKTTISARKYSEYRDLFPECIAAGVGLLVGQILLGQTVWRRLP